MRMWWTHPHMRSERFGCFCTKRFRSVFFIFPSRLELTQPAENKWELFLFQYIQHSLSHFLIKYNALQYIFKSSHRHFWQRICSHPSLHLFNHLFRVLVHCFDEGAHVHRVHVGVKAVAQVGDVALCAETLQHTLHDFRDPLLEKEWYSGGSTGEPGSVMSVC